MNIKIKVFIILYFSLILFFFVAKIYHINMGYFYEGFPLIIAILSLILLFLILSLFSKKKDNEHSKKYPPISSFILIVGLTFIFFSCRENNDVLSTFEIKSSSRNSVEIELEEFAKKNNLSKTVKETSNAERRFSNIVDFKKAILEYRKSFLKKSYVKIEIDPTIKTQPMVGMKSARISDSPPCGTANYNYMVNTQVYDYDGSADLNINLTYGINGNGQYTNTGIQLSQFGGTSDSFSSTNPQITTSPSGVIYGSFNTTQTNNWTINFGGIFSTNYNNTTLTRWHYVYNPCAVGSSRVLVEYEMNE